MTARDDIVLAAERLKDYVHETPLEPSARLSAATSNIVLFKREDLQPVHSFKIRGALNKLLQLTAKERHQGVLAASAGNHAQGVALGAELLGIPATIVMPRTTPDVKIQAVKGYGATVILEGDNYSQAYDYAQKLLAGEPRTFVHAFDDQAVIDGQGTIGLELLRQNPKITHIFIPGGGGGLAAGVAKAIKTRRPDIRIIIVEPEDSNAIQRGVAAGHPVPLDQPPSIFADGVAVQQVGDLTLQHILKYVDEVITVSKTEISEAIRDFMLETKHVLEGAGALSIAGSKQYATNTGCHDQVFADIVSGANISTASLREALERAELVTGREALFAVKLPEQAGSLRHFCRAVVSGHSITEFRYRRGPTGQTAEILIGFAMKDERDKTRFTAKMQRHGYDFVDFSEDDFVKDHLRHLVGGRRPMTGPEQLYLINLPERSGALAEFLDALHDRWNISLFHYRSFGSETGECLIGFETDERTKLERTFKQAHYAYQPVTSPAVKHFL